MSDQSAWGGRLDGAPLPVSKRPPIRPRAVQSLGPAAGMVIVATLLQAATVGWGVWIFDQIRRSEAVERMAIEGKAARSEAKFSEDDETPRDDEDVRPAAEEPANTHSGLSAENARRERAFRAEVERKRKMMLFFSVAGLVWGLEMLAFVVWQAQAHANVSELGAVGVKYGSGTSIVWWFVPVAVLWKPLDVLQEIWRGSDPSVAAGDELGWRLKRPSLVMMIWWGLLNAAKFLYWFSGLMFLGGLITIISPLEMSIIALSMTFVVDVLQIEVVMRVSGRQAALARKRLAAVKRAEGAGEPVVDVDELPSRVKRRPDETEFTCELEVAAAIDSDSNGGSPLAIATPAQETPLLLTDEHSVDVQSCDEHAVDELQSAAEPAVDAEAATAVDDATP